MGILLSAITFFQSNIKWIAILAIVILIGLGAWKYTALVNENATLKFDNSQLQKNIVSKDKEIGILKDLKSIEDRLVEESIKKNDELNKQSKSITKNLPPDASNPAPDSIKETLRRLRELNE